MEVVWWVSKLKVDHVGVSRACAVGKQTRTPRKSVKAITTKWCLELVHIDLMRPTQIESIGGKKYIFVWVDDLSHFYWIAFLREKS